MTTKEKSRKPSATERLWHFGRNINALGALALASLAVIIPGPNPILASWAGLNTAQAGGFELLRRHSKKKHHK